MNNIFMNTIQDSLQYKKIGSEFRYLAFSDWNGHTAAKLSPMHRQRYLKCYYFSNSAFWKYNFCHKLKEKIVI